MNDDFEKRYAEQFSGTSRANTGLTGGIARPTSGVQTGIHTFDSNKPTVTGSGLIDKVTSVAKQSASIGLQAADAVTRYVGNSAVDIGQSAFHAGKTVVDLATQPIELSIAQKTIAGLDQYQKDLNTKYRAGKISKDDYNTGLEHLAQSRKEINDKFLEPISDGPSAAERNKDILETTVNLLTLGKFSIVKVAVEDGARTILGKTVSTAIIKIQDWLLKVPAAKELIARNTEALATREAQQLAGESLEKYVAREGKRVAIGLLIKRPLFYQQNIQDATNIYTSMMKGDYGTALKSTGWMASQMVGGGPVGWFLKQGKNLGIKLRDLSYGKQSFIDVLSAEIGDKNPAQAARYLRELQQKAPDTFERHERIARIMQETNLRVADERVNVAVQNILSTYDQAGVSRENISFGMILQDYEKWHQAATIADALKGTKIQGLTPEQVNNLVVIRWDSVMKRGFAAAIRRAGDDKQALVAVLNDFSNRAGVGWGNNPNLVKQLTRIIDDSSSAEQAAKQVMSIPTATAMPEGLSQRVQNKLADLGYGVAVPMGGVRKTPVVTVDETRKLVSAAANGEKAIFDEASEPVPILSAIAGALDKAGLSPVAANRVANDSLRQSLAAGLSETEVGMALGMTMDGDTAKGGAAILSQLQRYVDNKKPALGLGKISSGKSAVTDIRMLTTRELGEALGISSKDAKQVQSAILDAYTKVPLSLRGLGERAVDLAYKYNPAQKYYARVQSALRYTYNPFFRVQEQVETAALSKMNANKFIWLKSKEELNGAVKRLSETGFFEGNLNSAAAEDVVFGRISANLTGFQKRNLAGLAMTIADRKGLNLDDMITKYPDEIEDALRVIVQYPNKGILASSMARTLNIAFFPMRYNAKLTMMAAQKIGELPPSLQLATIQGFLKMKDWMQSDEGIRWQATHADAIQVFKWVTPIGSIQQFYKVVSGNIESPADLGLLGGLPFGMISQMLDSQGVIRLNTPYVNPATGDVLPSYIPHATRARAATALQDLLGSMFSFPGRTLGLPGKGDTLRKAVGVFIDSNGSDFEKRIETDRLTPLQQRWVNVLKGDTSKQAVDALYTSPAPGQFNYYTLPPFELPIKTPTTAQAPLQERTGLPTRQPKTKKLPQPIPQR